MKEAYYFSHDCNARNDAKILAMRSKYGSEGYGWYWMIVEILREQTDYKLKNDKYLSITLAMQLQCDSNTIASYVHDCVEEFNLLQTDETYIWSDSLIRRMIEKELRTENAKKAANARWGKGSDDGETKKKSNENASAMQEQCEGNAIKESKGNESKEKDIISEFTSNEDLKETIKDFMQMRKKIKKPMTDKAVKLMLNKLNDLATNDIEKIQILNNSIENSWQGIFPLKIKPKETEVPTANAGARRIIE